MKSVRRAVINRKAPASPSRGGVTITDAYAGRARDGAALVAAAAIVRVTLWAHIFVGGLATRSGPSKNEMARFCEYECSSTVGWLGAMPER